MALFLIVFLLILLWVVSLCKVLFAPCPPPKVGFLFNGEDIRKRNVLLVVSHPDDESMFFSPTILYLTSRGHNLHILCMSTGDADGKGNIRKAELYLACATLKVPPQQVKILDHPDFQDGHDKVWSSSLLAKIIAEETTTQDIDLVSTSIMRKYSGPVDIWLSILFASNGQRGQLHCLLNEGPGKSFIAMAQHQSQWVWFRKLFVLFSSYTYMNMLRKINF